MSRSLNFFEKMALNFGVIYRHQANQFPRRFGTLKEVWAKELRPPTSSDLPKIKSEWQKLCKDVQSQTYKNFTVRELLVSVAVGMEICAWFFVGEMIGRRNIVGYLVPADYISKDTRKKAKAAENEKPRVI
ncbi:unnamed protein product, partial [Mesorhabditis belari]|uniref:ATP synthase subunit g, mitochondrial n=1 Tax=Mesorhabditis belari TaxID=2138241 RepID=A0AAF3JB64_9BILA